MKSELEEGFQAIDSQLTTIKNGDVIRPLLLPLISIPTRLLAEGSNNTTSGSGASTTADATRKRRNSMSGSGSDVRFEIYTRMLKALPDAHIIKEKMVGSI